MASRRIGIDRSGGRSKRLALHVLQPGVIVIGALLTACELLLAGPASAATLSPAALPGPSMTLTASATQVFVGEPPPVLTVTMPANATGEVGFYDSARPGTDKGIGLAPIIDGVARLAAPDRPLVLGANPITASYGGNAIYGPADSNTVTVTVVERLTATVTLASSATLLLVGHPPVLTARLPADATGTVSFYLYNNGRPCTLGTASVVGGTASITAAPACLQDIGSFYVDAVYSGDARYGLTRSNLVQLTIIGTGETLAFTGSQQMVPIPLGAKAMQITATGASGAGIGGCGVHSPAGGFGAIVSGIATLPAGAGQLIVDVGGAGNGQTGGWGGAAGGGSGGHRGGIFSGTGAGGGGATTVRLSSGGPPLLEAGGGGGAGDCGEFFSVGGNGGSADVTAGNGQDGSGGISPGSGGTGGTAATPAGTGGTGAGGGGGGGARGGEGGSGDSQGVAGGGGGAGSSAANSSLVAGVAILTATTTGNGKVSLFWISGLSPYTVSPHGSRRANPPPAGHPSEQRTERAWEPRIAAITRTWPGSTRC